MSDAPQRQRRCESVRLDRIVRSILCGHAHAADNAALSFRSFQYGGVATRLRGFRVARVLKPVTHSYRRSRFSRLLALILDRPRASSHRSRRPVE